MIRLLALASLALALAACSDAPTGALDDEEAPPADSVFTFAQAGIGLTQSTFPTSLVAGDYDDDGALDLIVVSRQRENFTVLTNDGSGTFARQTQPADAVATRKCCPIDVTNADMDRDGRPDLVVASGSSSGGFYVLRNAAPAHFELDVVFDLSNATFHTLGVHDFDGDGRPDVAVASYPSSLLFLLKNRTTPQS